MIENFPLLPKGIALQVQEEQNPKQDESKDTDKERIKRSN